MVFGSVLPVCAAPAAGGPQGRHSLGLRPPDRVTRPRLSSGNVARGQSAAAGLLCHGYAPCIGRETWGFATHHGVTAPRLDCSDTLSRLARASRTTAQSRDLFPESCFGPGETSQKLLERVASKVSGIHLEHTRAAYRASSDQAVAFESAQCLLDSIERRAQHARQLSRIALAEQREGEKDPGACHAPERTRGCPDHNY